MKNAPVASTIYNNPTSANDLEIVNKSALNFTETDILCELQERQKRANNIILFNVEKNV